MSDSVSVFGLGYVGCVSAACFASEGHRVIGVDVSGPKVEQINAGRSTIVEEGIASLVAEGVAPNKVDEKAIRRHLYFPDMPDPDLVIRTSGETRISNFLLWEIAYSELVFPEVLWPDMRRRHLYEAVIEFQQRVRRFGDVHP